MRNKEKIKQRQKIRRRVRVRTKIKGSAERPRLGVSRSLRHLYIQLIDDNKGVTLVSVKDSELEQKELASLKKVEVAHKAGLLVAKKALAKKIERVVFDKGANKYHGRVKAVAEGARAGGLKF
jgi:large subunit ribosomal protein L18